MHELYEDLDENYLQDLEFTKNYIPRDPISALLSDDLELFKALIAINDVDINEGKYNLDWFSHRKYTLLHVAAKFDQHAIVEYLLKIGADP